MRKQGKSGALAAIVESHASVIDTGPECDRNSWGKCSQSLGKRKAERSSVSQSAKDVFREFSKDSGHLSALFPHLQNIIFRTDWILLLSSLKKIPRMKQTKQLSKTEILCFVFVILKGTSAFFFFFFFTTLGYYLVNWTNVPNRTPEWMSGQFVSVNGQSTDGPTLFGWSSWLHMGREDGKLWRGKRAVPWLWAYE